MTHTPKSYSVRPLPKTDRSDLLDRFRVYCSQATLQQLGDLRSGDACRIQMIGSGPVASAIVWLAQEKTLGLNVLVSEHLRSVCCLKLGDKISITPDAAALEAAENIVLTEIQRGDRLLAEIKADERPYWKFHLGYLMSQMDILTGGLSFIDVTPQGPKWHKRSFRIAEVNSSTDEIPYRYHPNPEIIIQDAHSFPQRPVNAGINLVLSNDGIGGLDRQLDLLNERLKDYDERNERFQMPLTYQARRGGILLYGPSGTGKSLLLSKIAAARWKKVFRIDRTLSSNRVGGKEAALRAIFADACSHQPSTVIIDHLETIAGRIDQHDSNHLCNITPCLIEELDKLSDARVLVIAATRTLQAIDLDLRNPRRFGPGLEIPIPSSRSRTEILKILSGLPKSAPSADLDRLGEVTHGFVGSDLEDLVQRAMRKAIVRAESEEILNQTEHPGDGSKVAVQLTSAELENAFVEIRPTVMREVYVETPNVRWSDIGGQHEVKVAIREAVEWPYKYASLLRKRRIRPAKGLLLYGPPGCSKTLMAKAAATESGLNFLAVKGAELLNMYVGESERAVRAIFEKARAASPSIIFFDEIDTIGSSRDAHGHTGGIHTLTTLLNEMDGIVALEGVFILAATNKPEFLDSALTRPGRFDKTLYVGLPDHAARSEILKLELGQIVTNVDVNIDLLAGLMQGYSGAEVVSLCQMACRAAVREEIQSGECIDPSSRHFDAALKSLPRRISPEMEANFKSWALNAST